VTDAEMKAALAALIEAIVLTVHEVKEAPEVLLWLAFKERYPSFPLSVFNTLLDGLVRGGYIRRDNHLLTPGEKSL